MGRESHTWGEPWADRIPQFETACEALVPYLYDRSQAELPNTAHRFSPKKFTQPQLAAIVGLRRALFTTYRDIAQALRRSERARRLLGLRSVPHYSALSQAEKRLEAALEKIWPSTTRSLEAVSSGSSNSATSPH